MIGITDVKVSEVCNRRQWVDSVTECEGGDEMGTFMITKLNSLLYLYLLESVTIVEVVGAASSAQYCYITFVFVFVFPFVFVGMCGRGGGRVASSA